jgi:hypothetical protein
MDSVRIVYLALAASERSRDRIQTLWRRSASRDVALPLALGRRSVFDTFPTLGDSLCVGHL